MGTVFIHLNIIKSNNIKIIQLSRWLNVVNLKKKKKKSLWYWWSTI